MDKKEIKQMLIAKRMETKARLNMLRNLGMAESKYTDMLLDRLNNIDKLLKDLK